MTLQAGERRAAIAYTLGRTFWGAGYASEACRAALDHLGRASAVARVEAFIDTRNARSIALVERLGFIRRGFVANADYFKGSSSDEYVFEFALRERHAGETEP